MAMRYHPFKIALTDGQKASLPKAKPEQIGRGESLLLTATQINHFQKATGAGRGADLTISKTQITKLVQSGGTALSLARPLLVPAAKSAAKALATAGLSFAADKVLKKIFGKGYGPREVELYRLARRLTSARKKAIERHLVGKGMVRGGGSAQY